MTHKISGRLVLPGIFLFAGEWDRAGAELAAREVGVATNFFVTERYTECTTKAEVHGWLFTWIWRCY